ncbi:uracil-DNA glycosylase family protein [Spongorhabdus nitratireducens]
MNEALRQQYLGAMGIQPFYSRYRLPNAQPSNIQPTLPAANSAVVEAGEVVAASPHQVFAPPAPRHHSQPQPSSGANRARIDQLLGRNQTEQKPATPKQQPKAAEIETQPQPVPEAPQQEVVSTPFRVIVIAPNDHCLVVADMPHSGEKMVTHAHTTLLSNILKAVNEPVDQLEYREYSWPFSVRPFIVQDDTNAREALTEFLDNQYGLNRRKTLLLLGPYAARFVLKPDELFENLRGVRTFAAGHCAVSFSLDQMMKVPACKPDAWQDLRPLLQPSS